MFTSTFIPNLTTHQLLPTFFHHLRKNMKDFSNFFLNTKIQIILGDLFMKGE